MGKAGLVDELGTGKDAQGVRPVRRCGMKAEEKDVISQEGEVGFPSVEESLRTSLGGIDDAADEVRKALLLALDTLHAELAAGNWPDAQMVLSHADACAVRVSDTLTDSAQIIAHLADFLERLGYEVDREKVREKDEDTAA